MRRAALLAGLVALAPLTAGCASATNGASSATDATNLGSAAPSTTGTQKPAGELTSQFGVRYCEVLTITVGDTATKAEVWGTQGLNDCPQAAFSTIDPAKVRADLGVTAAVPNGPRYWVLDDIVAHALAGSGQIRDFGGIKMRSIATVDLGKGLPDRSPYKEISVKRDTEFRFDAGRTIYELTAPDSSVYVMQSYSLEIDPTLTVDALRGLGNRLKLPAGWTFTARVLDQPLVVEDVDGIATVIQDELHNSYQRRA